MKKALISLSDKSDIYLLAEALIHHGYEILSTGGTAHHLRTTGLAVTDISDITHVPEILDGRVKTLHPKIHGGILARSHLEQHQTALETHDIPLIDWVVVNLYPFAETIQNPQVTLEEAIENIDIGGPAMIRSGAKNHERVTVVTDPNDYPRLIQELEQNQGKSTLETRYRLAVKAFSHTAMYDTTIAQYLKEGTKPQIITDFPEEITLTFYRRQSLRYGENPHQKGAFYQEHSKSSGLLSQYTQIQGKELSYNNLADADCAWDCVRTLSECACVIVKHANPCGVGTAQIPIRAYQLALKTDPVSAFGGIIAFNRTVDLDLVITLEQQFVEVLIAPNFSHEALLRLKSKKSLRVLQIPLSTKQNLYDLKRIGGGLLIQTPDFTPENSTSYEVVTQEQPTEAQWNDLKLANHVAQYVKSNAIVFCHHGQTLGIGAGQMSRVDSTIIARRKANEAQLNLIGAVAASDAFFPFRDGIDVIAQAGIKAIIHPGGSIRDTEIIQAANEQGLAMVFTGTRHFRH